MTDADESPSGYGDLAATGDPAAIARDADQAPLSATRGIPLGPRTRAERKAAERGSRSATPPTATRGIPLGPRSRAERKAAESGRIPRSAPPQISPVSGPIPLGPPQVYPDPVTGSFGTSAGPVTGPPQVYPDPVTGSFETSAGPVTGPPQVYPDPVTGSFETSAGPVTGPPQVYPELPPSSSDPTLTPSRRSLRALTPPTEEPPAPAPPRRGKGPAASSRAGALASAGSLRRRGLELIPRNRRPGRKQLGIGGGTAAAIAAGGYLLFGRDGSTELKATVSSAKPAAVAPVTLPTTLDVEHLLRRVTYGPTPALRAEVAKVGVTAWLTQQLTPAAVPDPEGDAVGALFPQLALSGEAARASVRDRWAFQRDLAAAHLGRAVWSRRQLFEVMVDFWSNHFNIPCPGDKAQFTRHRFDADVIRKGALGRFEDLLQAAAIHPAMLDFLDNGNSVDKNPNENYARELLELHTVGLEANYTERDVQQAALLLTGFEIKHDEPRFVPSRHYVGPVAILGFRHDNDSRSDGHTAVRAFLAYLARHEATATALARKLAVRFVGDDPPAELVSRLAKTYLSNDTAITPVLVALFGSAEFAAASWSKIRRPMERLAATVRALGITPGTSGQGLVELYWMLDPAGHKPLGWPTAGGYPDRGSAWQSPAAALAQFNAATHLVQGSWPRSLVNPGPGKLLATPPTTRDAVVDAVGARVLGRSLTAAEHAAAVALLESTQLPTALPAGSWELSTTVGQVATLLLTSPAYLTR